MEQTIKIITGKVAWDIYGGWSDVVRGLFIDTLKVESIFNEYVGKNIKVTIEVVEDK